MALNYWLFNFALLSVAHSYTLHIFGLLGNSKNCYVYEIFCCTIKYLSNSHFSLSHVGRTPVLFQCLVSPHMIQANLRWSQTRLVVSFPHLMVGLAVLAKERQREVC